MSLTNFGRFAAALVLFLAGSLAVQAHEVRPTIGDLTSNDGTLSLVLRLNAEAVLAGIDLDEVEDTDDTEQSGTYDDLRALSDDALANMWQEKGAAIPLAELIANGQTVSFRFAEISVQPEPEQELPRESEVTLTAVLPDAATDIQLHWLDGRGNLILRQMGVEEGFTGYLSGGQTSEAFPLEQGVARSGWAVFAEYIPVGFDHILPKGLDHILFVLGLFFLSTRLHSLLWQVSAFTVAHTVTLALGAMGWVNVPGSIVEPLIAASIVYVAVENILSDKLHKWRPLVIFGFGLLHGLGFASVLGEFGLPTAQFVPALIGFNVGVEFGQLTVIAIAFLAVGLWFRNKPWYRTRIAVPASVMIALVGAYWFVERVFL